MKMQKGVNGKKIRQRIVALVLCICMLGSVQMLQKVYAESFPEWNGAGANGTALKNFTIWDCNVVLLDTSEFSSKVTWKSSDPMVAYVIEDYLFAFKKGTATITAKADGKTKKFKVKVKSNETDKLGLNAYEITLGVKDTFQLYCGNTAEAVKWSSSDSKVASIDKKGKVKAVKCGKATITAASRGKTVKCKITVIKNSDYTVMPNPGGYSQKQLTAEPTVIEDMRFVLIVDRGIYVPKDIKKRMNTIMNAIEKTTGLSFTPKDNGIQRTTDKVILYACNRHENTEAIALYGNLVYLQPIDIALDTYGDSTIIHELLHLIQQRNIAALGNCLTEGFAMYYEEKILNDISEELIDLAWNSSEEWLIKENESKIESTLINPKDAHASSYFFFKYLMKTYDRKKVDQIYKDITSATIKEYKRKQYGDIYVAGVSVLTDKQILSIIKKDTSANVTKNFAKWLKKQFRDNMIFDFSGQKTKIMNVDYAFWGDLYQSAIYKYKDSITLDFSKGIGFEQNVVGKKYCGMYGCAKGNGTMTFYNSKGKVLKTIRLNSSYETRFEVKGAAKIKLSGGNKVDMYYDNEHIFK